MAHLDPDKSFEHLRDRTLEAIEQQFPIRGRSKVLELESLEVGSAGTPDDIRAQHAAKVKGETWGVPVYANLVLKDNNGNEVRSRTRVAELPKMTRRYSFIVDGQEYQVDNQWQLKPGAYVRRRQTGEIETRFQSAKKPSFDVTFDDKSKVFRMEYGSGKAKIPLYPILRTLGVSDAELEKAWGAGVLDANRKGKKVETAVEQFYKTTRRTSAPDANAAAVHLIQTLRQTDLRPDATEISLGKPLDHVNGEALLRATNKMLQVQRGGQPDDRDSLVFKDLRSVGDFANERIRGAASVIKSKALRRINESSNPRDIIKFDTFNKPLRETWTKIPLAQFAKQVNPVEMVSTAQQTTVTGPGGIQSEQSIVDETKFVNASHMAFLDPIHTPEGRNTGVSLRLPISVVKKGNEPQVPLYNLRTGETEYVGPRKFLSSKIVLPDQVEWKSGKPKPITSEVKMSGLGNAIEEAPFAEADYAMAHPSQFFNATSNLIPFLSSTSGGRASMAARHLEQAISLESREAPLVQVGTAVDKDGARSFEEILGIQASHRTPVAGVVKAVKDDAIVVSGADGKDHEVQLYKNYPLNDAKSVLDSTVTVKVGDKLRQGQVVADTNFSKDGSLALGTNLRVGYIPYKGYNFEDGIVISESAAKRLTSVHLNKESLPIDADTTLSKRKFSLEHGGLYNGEQLKNIDDDGVARVGSKVLPGDPLILATRRNVARDRSGLAAIRKGLGTQYEDRSLTWEGEVAGEVVEVARKGKEVTVHVRTSEPMQIGDKLSGRHGNKGIVTMIVPDDAMPKTKDGKAIDVALNPSGVPGRINVGQVLETAASKVARKSGKPFVVDNFGGPGSNQLEKVKRALKDAGLSDTEELIDPGTGLSLGKALVGDQYMLKLHHQVDKKVSARSGLSLPGVVETERYDLNLQPSGGGHTGGQSMDPLGLYSLLAHGARANIREMQTWKSEGPDPNPNAQKRWASQHHDVWDAIQHGNPFPTPKPTFAFRKFEDMLRGSGINIEKKGHNFVLSPLTDSQILSMTGNRVLPNSADKLRAKLDPKTGEPRPQPGGLFDERLTGGHGGRKWSRIDLAEPVPNPVFEQSIRAVLGLRQNDYDAVVSGEKAVDNRGNIVELGSGNNLTGGAGIEALLRKVDVDRELSAAQKELDKAPASKVDGVLKKVKRLRALKEAGLTPVDAYVLHHLPVIPPAIRPITVMQDGNLRYSDINELYSQFAQNNTQLKDPVLKSNLTDADKQDLRKGLYDGVKALMGVGIPYGDVKHKGLLHQIHGDQPKTGFFQSTLISRRQDMSMRSTIVPEPSLALDEVGLPKEHALRLFAPFVVRQLHYSGMAKNVAEAQKLVSEGKPQAIKALQKVMEERPVLLKRDPALHKYSVQAFKPRMVEGNTIKIHPLTTGGYNADFDGDSMSVFVPVHAEAVEEARKMFPSNNVFSEASGRVMYQPTLESALGLFKLTMVNDKAPKKVSTHGEAIKQVQSGSLSVNDPIRVGNQTTTAGRVLVAAAVPEPLQKDILEKLDFRIDKKGLDKVFTTLARDYKGEFGEAADKLKNLGNGAASGIVNVEHSDFVGANRLDPKLRVTVPVGVHTLSLDDFTPDITARESALKAARGKVQEIKANPKLRGMDEEREIVSAWQTADKQMRAKHLAAHASKPDNLLTMQLAGVKPNWDQYKQLRLAPMLVADASGRVIPTPITHSYPEGLDTGEYWTQMHGARRGSVLKVQQVREPGYLSKLLMQNTMDIVVSGEDCGTSRGVSLDVTDRDANDRVLQRDFRAKDVEVPAGTVLNPTLLGRMRAADKSAKIVVRSPLKCEHEKGVCQKCMGLTSSGGFHSIGDNVGVTAAQSLGERAVQLTLRVFHTGGAVGTGGGSKALGGFDAFNQLMRLPKKIPDAATLAMRAGAVEKIEPDATGVNVWVGGRKHHVGKDSTGAPLWKAFGAASWVPPKVGSKVERGQPLSDPTRTRVNPHDLYKATNSIETVQNHLVDEVHKLYRDEGIKRSHIETVVKSISNLTKVEDPGDAEGVLRGEFRPTSKVQAMNRALQKSGKRPVEHKPVLKGVDMMPLSVQEDWMAKLQHQRLSGTLLEAAALLGKSDIHGMHPIPGMAYGAEFGLNKQHANKPSLSHLSDVAEFNY